VTVRDPNDRREVKTAQNTVAQHKSREKKAKRFEELEARIAALEEENHALKGANGASKEGNPALATDRDFWMLRPSGSEAWY
jgi:hypothetical protein